MQLFRRKTKQRYLACVGLFALLMLTIGPVTSQIIAMVAFASHSSSPASHHTMMMDHSDHQTEQPLSNNSSSMPPNHHMSLCGYCDLLHTPVLFSSIPVIAQAATVHQYTTPYHLDDIFTPLYNSPLSRAPPSFS